MKNRLMCCLVFTLFLSSAMLLPHTANAAPKNGTVRVSGDNTWVVFVNGEEVAQSAKTAPISLPMILGRQMPVRHSLSGMTDGNNPILMIAAGITRHNSTHSEKVSGVSVRTRCAKS